MIAADKEVAYRIVNSNLMELLMAISKVEEPERLASAKLAEQALKQAEEWDLIQSVASMWLISSVQLAEFEKYIYVFVQVYPQVPNCVHDCYSGIIYVCCSVCCVCLVWKMCNKGRLKAFAVLSMKLKSVNESMWLIYNFYVSHFSMSAIHCCWFSKFS